VPALILKAKMNMKNPISINDKCWFMKKNVKITLYTLLDYTTFKAHPMRSMPMMFCLKDYFI
jgi:hypothetical protein